MHNFACDMLPAPIFYSKTKEFCFYTHFNLNLKTMTFGYYFALACLMCKFRKDYYGMIYKNPPKTKRKQNFSIQFYSCFKNANIKV